MAKKQIMNSPLEPWKGIMTKENYDSFTKSMTRTEKKEFDTDLINHETNTLMSLGGLGLYEPAKKRTSARGRKNGAKK